MMLSVDELRVRLGYLKEPDEKNEKKRRPPKNLPRIGLSPRPVPADIEGKRNASIDLHLGRWFRVPRGARNTHHDILHEPAEERFSKRHFVPFGEEFVIHPSRFVLGSTVEWINMPFDLAGFVVGRSSVGRRGLIIETAPTVHPGYVGCLTLELANVGEVPIVIRPGMAICQLLFHRLDGVKLETTADSQFSGTRMPELGKLKGDELFNRIQQHNERRSRKDTSADTRRG